MSEEQSNLPIAFEEPPAVEVVVDTSKAKAARKAKIAEAKAYEQLGQRLLKFKAKKFGALGDYIIGQLGVKKVGHGTIISASENADQYIRKCDAIVNELLKRDPPCDPEAIVEVLRLAKEFNQQLLDSGEAHLRIDRQPVVAQDKPPLLAAFPPSTPMQININTGPPVAAQKPLRPAAEPVEDEAPAT